MGKLFRSLGDQLSNLVTGSVTKMLDGAEETLTNQYFAMYGMVQEFLLSTPSIAQYNIIDTFYTYFLDLVMLVMGLMFILTLKFALINKLAGNYGSIKRTLLRGLFTFLIVSNAAEILYFIFELNDSIIGEIVAKSMLWNGQALIDAAFNISLNAGNALEAVTNTLMESSYGLLIIFVMVACLVVLYCLLFYRMFELSLHFIVAPLFFVCYISEISSSVFQAYIRSVIGITMKSLIYVILIIVYIAISISMVDSTTNMILFIIVSPLILVAMLINAPKKITGYITGGGGGSSNMIQAVKMLLIASV